MPRTAPPSLPDYRWPDAWVGRRRYAPWRWLAAAAFHLGRLAGRAVWAVRPNRSAVAVIRTDGAGDAVLFEPVLRALAKRFGGPIDLWLPDGPAALLGGHPSVAAVVPVPRGFKQGNHAVFWSVGWRAKLGYRLGRHAYRVAIYPPDDPEPLGSWLLASCRADERWLNAGSTLNQFDWQRQRAHAAATRRLAPRPQGGHELLRDAHLAEQCEAPVDGNRPRLTTGPRAATYAGVLVGAARHAARRARAAGVCGFVVSGSSELNNQYPLERWAEIIQRTWQAERLLPALLGGRGDAARLDAVAARVPGAVPLHRFPLDHDIAVASAVVMRLDALVSVDTGLAHVAVAADLPTVVLVTGGMPGRFWPWPGATRSLALTRDVPCVGCNYRCTQATPICVTEITPDDVVAGLSRVLRTARILPSLSTKEYRHAG